uniref:PA118R n=1 Tax=African swine fever virus TaxID=10497 RepID=A0A6G7KU62_ASF
MHSIAFFILIACVLFPTRLSPSMAICIPRMIITWAKRIQFSYKSIFIQHCTTLHVPHTMLLVH